MNRLSPYLLASLLTVIALTAAEEANASQRTTLERTSRMIAALGGPSEVFDELYGREVLNDRQARGKFAADLGAWLVQIDASIPELLPADADWIGRELGAIRKITDSRVFGERWLKLTSRSEYLRWTTKGFIKQIILTLKQIETAEGAEEFHLWLDVARLLLAGERRFAEMIQTMVEGKEITASVAERITGAPHGLEGLHWRLRARSILNEILPAHFGDRKPNEMVTAKP